MTNETTAKRLSRLTLKKGDVVRTIYGEAKTVQSVTSCAIYFYDGSWAHPTKCWNVKK